MSNSPDVVARPAQPYVGVPATVTMATIAEIADRLPEIAGWLGERGLDPAGPPFLRYRSITMPGPLLMEAGFPVGEVPDAVRPGMVAGELPAGRYARLTHVGHPDELERITGDLLAWGEAHGVAWDRSTGAGGAEQWGCRLESYLTDPRIQPDMAKWKTVLEFRLADGGR